MAIEFFPARSSAQTRADNKKLIEERRQVNAHIRSGLTERYDMIVDYHKIIREGRTHLANSNAILRNGRSPEANIVPASDFPLEDESAPDSAVA